jgi:hypothetical protein
LIGEALGVGAGEYWVLVIEIGLEHVFSLEFIPIFEIQGQVSI